jgi:carotenoid 1,2-hydratase
MTERGRSALARDASTLSVGPSALAWDGDMLTLSLDEITVPVPRRMRGTIRLHPTALASRSFDLDAAGRHRWMPIAPVARVEVAFDDPALSWSGHGYLDTNSGDEPVARAFREWDWSRADLPDGAAVLYDIVERDGGTRSIAARYDRAGNALDFEPPPRRKLPSSPVFRVPRRTQAEPGGEVRVVKTLEDTPFYARSVLHTRLFGHRVTAVHESLSVRRLDTTLVRLMLPWRMPRRFF